MPNNCCNRVTVSGPQDQIEEMKKAVLEPVPEDADSGIKPKLLSADKVLPMPKCLEGSTSPPRDNEVAAALVAECGYPDWYSFCNDVWGTKWGNYEFTTDEWVKEDVGDAVYFLTAWSPSYPVTIALSIEWPELTFLHECQEPGAGYAGFRIYQNGDCIEMGDYGRDETGYDQLEKMMNKNGLFGG